MKRIENTSLREKIALEIKNAILSGEIKAGTILTQEKIAEDLGVSRMPVREALLALERDNFIEFSPTKKAVVLPFSLEDIKEHYTLRAILESECAKMAAIQDNDYTTLVKLHEKMLACKDYSKYLSLNRQFHTEIHQLSHLKKTVKLVENLWGAIPPVIRRDHVKYLEKSNQEHDNLVKAITSKNDTHAKAIMEAHIMRSYQDFLQEKSTK